MVTFAEIMHLVALGFEVVVAVELVVGLLWSVVLAAVVWRRTRDGGATYQALRQCFGSVLLLGLELLVAADLVRTVAVQPTLEELSALGLLVLIRTFLSFALEVEINGVPPWRRWQVSGAQRIAETQTLLGPSRRGSHAFGASGGRRQRRGARRGGPAPTGCPVTDTLVPDSPVPVACCTSRSTCSTSPDSLSSDPPPLRRTPHRPGDGLPTARLRPPRRRASRRRNRRTTTAARRRCRSARSGGS